MSIKKETFDNIGIDLDAVLDGVIEDAKGENTEKEKLKIADMLDKYVTSMQSMKFKVKCRQVARKYKVSPSYIQDSLAQKVMSSIGVALGVIVEVAYVTLATFLDFVSSLAKNVLEFSLNLIRKIHDSIFKESVQFA